MGRNCRIMQQKEILWTNHNAKVFDELIHEICDTVP